MITVRSGSACLAISIDLKFYEKTVYTDLAALR